MNRILKGGATKGCFSGLGYLHASVDLIRVFSELSGLGASLGYVDRVYQLPCEFGVSMGWLVCVFQWTVCVWVFFVDSVD